MAPSGECLRGYGRGCGWCDCVAPFVLAAYARAKPCCLWLVVLACVPTLVLHIWRVPAVIRSGLTAIEIKWLLLLHYYPLWLYAHAGDVSDDERLVYDDNVQNSSLSTYYTQAHKVSPTSTSCDLPLEPLRLYTSNHFRSVRPSDSNFLHVPPGGATQNYDISVSNDNATYSNALTYTIYDGDCMDCHGSDCTQLVCLFA